MRSTSSWAMRQGSLEVASSADGVNGGIRLLTS